MVRLMSLTKASVAPPSPPVHARLWSAVAQLGGRRSVRLLLVAWGLIDLLLVAIGGHHLPFSASALADPPTRIAVLTANAMIVEVLAMLLLVHALTRRRARPDVAARVPARPVALHETLLMVVYGIAAMAGGAELGHVLGWHAFGFHLEGMVLRTTQQVVPAEAFAWAAYNAVAYALVPFVVFRYRYSAQALGLRSTDRRADRRLIAVVLVVESAVQLASASSSILDLSVRQAVLGGSLTFALGMAGTVLPTMVFVQCILVPRYLALTGSVPATVALGGLTYALLHVTDGWTDFTSPTDVLLSVLYVLLFYPGPGMVKAFLTVRTGNAWVHVWAYHAIAPHTLLDSPMIVNVFGIR